MDFSRKHAMSVLALTLATIWATPDQAFSGGNAPGGKKLNGAANGNGASASGTENSVLRIPANSQFPVSRALNLGVGRSMMIQFPMELKDVMVSDPDKVDIILQTNDRIFLIAKKPGSANVFFFDTQSNQIATIDVNIGSDLSNLDALIKRLIPGANVKSELAGATIVLTGTVRAPSDSQRAADLAVQYAKANKGAIGRSTYSSSSTTVGNVTTWETTSNSGNNRDNDSKSVINMIQVEADEQVMLKVTVAEVNRTVLKQFGINLANSITASSLFNTFGTMNTLPLTSTTLGGMTNAGVVTSGATAGSPACSTILPQVHKDYVNQSGISGSFNYGAGCLSYTLRALERQGLVRTLAEPTLVAVSGESAKFLAGGEYPVPTSSTGTNGISTVGITFKEFGVAVAFTPQVLSEGRISLKIDTGVSELSNEGALVLAGTQIPSLRKRSALSTIELPSGGSMALAGLISDTTRANVEGLPGLKDLPVLGALFRSRDFVQAETELVLIVTPYLVRSTSRNNLSAPTDGLAPSSDLKANFLGEINRVYGKGKPIPDGGLKGSHGFIVD